MAQKCTSNSPEPASPRNEHQFPDILHDSRADSYSAPQTVPRLSPEQLAELGERLANASDAMEIAELKKALMNGFYGTKIESQQNASPRRQRMR